MSVVLLGGDVSFVRVRREAREARVAREVGDEASSEREEGDEEVGMRRGIECSVCSVCKQSVEPGARRCVRIVKLCPFGVFVVIDGPSGGLCDLVCQSVCCQ